MSIGRRSHRPRFHAWWTTGTINKQSSAANDTTPPAADITNPKSNPFPDGLGRATRLLPTNPPEPPLSSPSSACAGRADATMTAQATISFSRPGLQPPVYVVTSLSEPPWEALEMSPSEGQQEGEDLVFSRSFHHVAAGAYQYKVRIGEGHWVVDESKETATDRDGNWNNVVHATIREHSTPLPAHETRSRSQSNRKDSTVDPDGLAPFSDLPVPFVAVEKVSEKELLEHVHGELDAAPLFRHETILAEDSPISLPLDTIDEASPDLLASQDLSTQNAETTSFRHELEAEHEGGNDELNFGPLLSHETGLGSSIYDSYEENVDELDSAPLLSHESTLSRHDKRHSTNLGASDWHGEEAKQRHSNGLEKADSDHSDDMGLVDDGPLLPHERSSTVASRSGSELEFDDPRSRRQGSSDLSSDDVQEPSGRPTIFRMRTNSSTLPHRLPRSDAEDDDLNDPTLERFPTERASILERVASIGLQLEEDQTLEEFVHSPAVSILSQACSSIDLAPVKSYASLASVPEGHDLDEHDMESLPSPVQINFQRSHSGFMRSPRRLSPHEDGRRYISREASRSQTRSVQTTQSSEAESVGKTDGAKDVSRRLQDALVPTSDSLSTALPKHLGASHTSKAKANREEEEGDKAQERQSNTSASENVDSTNKAVNKRSHTTRTAIMVTGLAVAIYYVFRPA